jgi:hypothetical protein
MIYDTTAENDTVNLALESLASVIHTVQIDCFSGQSLYMSATVPDLTVEARHGTVGAWTDLETTAIDLTPYDGSRETFQIQITAPAAASHYTRAFPVYVGPTIHTDFIVYSGDQLLFSGDDLTFTH